MILLYFSGAYAYLCSELEINDDQNENQSVPQEMFIAYDITVL